MPTNPTIHIIDDDEALRNSLMLLMEAEGLPAKSYPSAHTFIESIEPETSGCILLDVRMPGMNGLELHSLLKKKNIPLPVIIMTGHGDVQMAVEAMKAGVTDFIEKPFNNDLLLQRIRGCLDLSTQVKQEQDKQEKSQALISLLTHREREVMEIIIDGKFNKEIARALDISTRTVEIHRANIMKKLNAKTTADIVRISLEAQT